MMYERTLHGTRPRSGPWVRAVLAVVVSTLVGGCSAASGQGIVAPGQAAEGQGANVASAAVDPATNAAPTAEGPAVNVSSAAEEPGTKVAFVREGSLWVQAVDGGEPVQIATGQLSHPRWSPSGAWLLADEGERVRVVAAGGSEAAGRTLDGFGAVWAPGEDLIAYRDPAGNLVVSDPLGEQERVVVDAAVHGSAGSPVWSPEGTWLAFQLSPAAQEPGPPRATIWKIGVDGRTPVQVLAPADEEPTCLKLAGWSPDGAAILYWPVRQCSNSLLADGAPLMAVPADGGTPQRLVATMLAHDEFLAHRPMANQMAVAAGGGRMVWHAKWIELLDLETGSANRISPESMAATSPTWSSDGRQVAFVGMPDAGPETGDGEAARTALQERRIWLAAEDGEPTQLTQEAGYRDESPHWTPDGVLFARLDAAEEASLWVVDPGAGPPRRIADVDAPPDAWFGYYGWLDWQAVFAVHVK